MQGVTTQQAPIIEAYQSYMDSLHRDIIIVRDQPPSGVKCGVWPEALKE